MRPAGLEIRFCEPRIDPADQITAGDIADEQEQAEGRLVEAAISQVVARQRAGRLVVGLAAGPRPLFVATVVELPVAVQLGAGGPKLEILADRRPGRLAVVVDVLLCDGVSDAL